MRSQLTALLLVFVAPALVLLTVTWVAVGVGGDHRHRVVRDEAASAVTEPPAPQAPVPPAALSDTSARMGAALEAGAFPGAALVIGEPEETLLAEGLGRIGWGANAPPADPDSTSTTWLPSRKW